METFEKSGTTNDGKKFRHQLIQKEFREALTSIEYEIPVKTDGVVILSGKNFIKDGESIDYSYPENAENKERIEMGIEIIKQIVAKKTNKSIDEIGNEDILQHAPSLILSGTTKQLPIMKQIVEEMGFPVENLKLVNCEASGISNTKTQFETINNYFAGKKHEHITFITSDYHVPRAVRTGYKNLNQDINFDIIPVPHGKIPYDVFKVVYGEVKKIISYANNGDISKDAPAAIRKK